jgi:AcrR family transcriptional regulator
LLTEVNVTAPSLYHHFGNREGLMVEAQAQRFLRSIRMDLPVLLSAINNSSTVADLQHVVKLAVSYRGDNSRINQRLQRLNALGGAYARPELAARIVEAHETMVREVATALRPFQDRGLIRADIDLEMVVAFYNGALLGGLLVELEPSELDANKWDVIMIDAMNHVLFGL